MGDVGGFRNWDARLSWLQWHQIHMNDWRKNGDFVMPLMWHIRRETTERETVASSWVFSALKAKMGPRLPVRLNCCLETDYETPAPISGHLDLLRGKTCSKQDIDKMVPTWIRGRGIARHYLWSRELSPCPEVLSSLCQVCICGWFIPWHANQAVCYPIFPHPRLW